MKPGLLVESIAMQRSPVACFKAAVLLPFLLCLSFLSANAQQNSPDQATSPEVQDGPAAAEKIAPPATVSLEGQPVLTVYDTVMSLTPEERARNIKKRIIAAADDDSASVEDVHMEPRDGWTEISVGRHMIVAVTDSDAKSAGMTRQALTAENAQSIVRAIGNYRNGHSWRSILRGILMTVVTTLVLVPLLWIVRRMRIALRARLERKIQASQLAEERTAFQVSFGYFGPILLAVGSIIRWILILAVLEAYLSFTFRFFSFTRDMALGLTSWIVSQLVLLGGRGLDYLPNLAIISVLLLITYWFIRLMRLIFSEIDRGSLKVPGFYPDWALPTEKLVRVLVLAFALIVVFPYLPGVKSQAFQGITIFLGVLLSLGSSSAVANAVAGVILTYMRSYLVGDWVEIGGSTGEVVEKTILITRLLTPKDEVITIPNATVMGGAVRNFTVEAKKSGVIFHTTVTIGYDAPWRTVHRLLVSAALATPNVRSQPTPFVLQSALNDFYVSYELNAYTDKPREMLNIFSDLHKNIQDGFNAEGVEICSPHFSALRDGNVIAIPGEYVRKDYQAPGFRIDGSRAGSFRDPGSSEIGNTQNAG
jgi:small-conductance mechanosensitive channel